MTVARLQDLLDAAVHGSKAARLSFLLRRGFCVPPGIVVSGETAPAELRQALRPLRPPFAVRSSAAAEDSGIASFAGQFETILRVPADGVAAAVRRCSDSSRNPRALAYARTRGVEPGPVAVIVQEMVDAECAGVLFTANPVTHDLRQMVVHATDGTGEKVAAGTVKPREIVLRKDERPSDPMLRELAAAGGAVEAAMGEPADIEWAWSRGRLYILQARPITTLLRRPPRPREYSNVYVWTHVNFAETMPKPASPLGWSLMEWLAERAVLKGLRLRNQAGYRLFEFLFGRVYWNITPVFGSPLLYRLLSHSLDGLAPSIRPDLDRLFEERSVRPRPIFSPVQKLVLFLQLCLLVPKLLASLIPWLFCHRRMARRLDEFESMLRRPAPLKRYLESAADEMRRRYLPAFHLSVLFLSIYSQLAPKLFRMSLVETLEFVTAETPDLTTQADLSLWKLARRPPGEFPAALEAHLRRFGHRGPKEQDILHPRMAETPELAVALVDNLRSTVSSYEQRRFDRDRNRRARMASLPWWRRALVEPLRRMTARFAPYRENGKHYLMLVFQRVRQAALSLGTRDAFFLTIDELLAGRRPNIDSRKADWARYQNVHAPLVVTSDGRVFSGRPATPSADALRGDAASAGVATGRVRVILDPASNARLEPGEILVAPHTDPGWTPLFPAAAAIVTEIGGVLSHGAVVARELGVPSVVNVADATKILKDGETITVDGTRGEVLRHSDN